MINKKGALIGMILIFGIILSLGFISSYASSNVQFTQYQPSAGLFGAPSSLEFDASMCKEGRDFLIQIAPFGCTPAVVRSDLLEEQNVPVFCQLAATQINPLIDVEAIESLSFIGKYPSEVAGIGFEPYRSALGGKEELNQPPILDNIGYAIIVLKKQQNESAMPDYVEGTLGIKIKYDIKNAFGIGRTSFHLPVLTDEEWEERKTQYGFWSGKGFLRAEAIEGNEAKISLYDGAGKKVRSVVLNEGGTSEKIYLPGFYCLSSLELKLQDLEAPDTRAKLLIDNDYVEVKKGEKFLDDRCSVTDLYEAGILDRVVLSCREDDSEGIFFKSSTHILSIVPKINLSINGTNAEYRVGDLLYTHQKPGEARTYYVYLGYANTKGNTGLEKDLEIIIIEIPDEFNPADKRLDDNSLNYVGRLAKAYSWETKKGAVDASKIAREAGQALVGVISNFFSYITTGKSIAFVSYDGTVGVLGGEKPALGKKVYGDVTIKINGFAEPVDISLDTGTPDMYKAREYYNLAGKDLNTIIDSYNLEKETGANETYGEKALQHLINLNEVTGQKSTVVELCEEYKEKYNKELDNCKGISISNSDIDTAFVTINGRTRQITLTGIYEPSLEEYSAEVLVKGPNKTAMITLAKGRTVYLDDFRNESNKTGEFIEILDLDNEKATLRVSVLSVGPAAARRISQALLLSTQTLELGKPQTFGSEYVFTLSKVNLKKDALVTVIPGIDNAGSEANFTFKIGIEKRAIQLSPSRIRNMISNLNDSIERWNDTSAKLGKVVKGLKSACLVSGIALTVKNFFANIGGKGIARQSVMRGEGGWYDICSQKIKDKEVSTLDECYTKYSSQIDKDVDLIYRIQQQQQRQIQRWQEGATKSGGILQDSVVDTDKYMESAISDVKKSLRDAEGKILFKDQAGNKRDISGVLNYQIYSEQGTFTPEELRDLQLNSMILKDASASEDLKKAAQSRFNSIAGRIYSASKEYEATAKVSGLYNLAISDSVRIPEKELKYLPYTGRTEKDFLKQTGSENIPAQLVSYSTGNFIVLLEKQPNGEYGPKRYEGGDLKGRPIVYDAKTPGVPITDPAKIPKELDKIVFQKADESSYKNKGFKNIEIKFYETAPYEGLPSIVPIDTKNGWYVATKQTLPVFGGIGAYDKSGRVSSFYLCHVGNNGLQEFTSGIGDDTCQMINLGTGMTYSQFPGLNESDAKKYVNCGVSAIEQASRAYKSKTIKISTSCGTVTSNVGAPAVDLPAIQCQDFMSPTDCRILYNLCDPVICPSSRCDLGGTYPVKDPIQTGIIGGLILCLPNFPQVYIPVCLTGIQAGIDGLVSVFTAHRDCLQEQLDTGKTVGICDEMYSIYLCELFWRQALPLAEIAIPKIISAIVGGGARGGGEYLGVQNAWNTASKSFNFFTQQYAVNSFNAFKLRTTEQIGTEVCRSFVSGVVPSMDFVDQLTEPDSPSQFHGRFDEIPFTTTTSPPISQYKVFYHIYAGKDSSAYYKVYLQGSPESSYYQDTAYSRLVSQGYIAAGGIATETKDFTAPSGYQKLCINVNGQEECGFKEVTTSLALNYVRDQYIKEQATATDIKSEAECISGSSSVYSLLSPNLQEGVSQAVNPSVYNYGITRVCSTRNPGEGTDPNAGGNGSRWVKVGICGNEKIKCWIDKSKIDDITKFRSVEDEILSDLNQNTLKLLQEFGKYIDDKIKDKIKEVETAKQTNKDKAISMITELVGQVFYNRNKAKLYLLRGEIYTEIAKSYFDKEITRLEGKRTEELEKKQIGEIKAMTGQLTEEQKQQILNPFSKTEQENIKSGRCENCGRGGLNKCGEKECLAIGRYNNINCVYGGILSGKCEFVEKLITVNFTGTLLFAALDFLNEITYSDIDYSSLDGVDLFTPLFISAKDITLFDLLDKMGVTYQEPSERNIIITGIKKELPTEKYETILTKSNQIITCFHTIYGFRFYYVSKDCGKTFISQKIETKTKSVTDLNQPKTKEEVREFLNQNSEGLAQFNQVIESCEI